MPAGRLRNQLTQSTQLHSNTVFIQCVQPPVVHDNMKMHQCVQQQQLSNCELPTADSLPTTVHCTAPYCPNPEGSCGADSCMLSVEPESNAKTAGTLHSWLDEISHSRSCQQDELSNLLHKAVHTTSSVALTGSRVMTGPKTGYRMHYAYQLAVSM